MKVNVVIATYNRASVIEKAIDSVLAQTHRDLELIIVDDGSTDDTASLIEKYKTRDSRVRYVSMPENAGATKARNRGIKEATGDFIMVWDSDDELYPQALKQVVARFESDPSLGIVSASCKQVQLDGNERPYTKVSEGEISLPQILCKYLPNNEKVRIARAELFKQVQYEARNIDFMVNGYLASLGKWYHLGEELGVLHLESDEVSLTTSRKKPNRQRSIERVEPLLRFFGNFGDIIRQYCPQRHAALAYGLSVGLLLQGRTNEARAFTNQAVQSDGLWLYKKLWLLARVPGGHHILRLLIK